MKRKELTMSAFLCALILFGSCSKDDASEVVGKESALTAEQAVQKENLKHIALAVASVSGDKTVFNEVQAAVRASLNIGLDEQYRFKDALNPSQSKITALRSSAVGEFGKKMMDALKNSGLRSSSTGEDMETFLISEDVQIYWPYSEDWDGVTEPVVTFDPIAEVDENIGFKRVLQEDGTFRIDTVVVNEAYACKNPVWVVNFCENDEADIEQAELKAARLKNTATVHQVSVGWVKSTKHYDGFFHGGDEYKFCFIGGNILSMNTAESFSTIQTINLSRSDINNERWKCFYYELDDDWNVDANNSEMGRKFGLIEFDNDQSTRELKFEPKVTINKITVSLGSYTIKTESNEGWIKTDTYLDRDQMIRCQTIDMGLGLKDGFRIYGAGNVYWTLPIREF